MSKIKKNTKRRLRIVIAALLILTVLYLAAANFLVSAALVPATMEKLEAFESITQESVEALVHTDDIEANRQAALDETAQWLESVSSERLTAVSEDGYELVAKVFYQDESAGETHKWALRLHGYTGWKEEMNPFAHWYYEQGYQVITPDMRCQGESEGDFIGMGWTDRKDNMIWLDYILEQDPDAGIVIHGQSMGGACALMMSGEDLGSNVKALISDCAYTDAYSMFKKQMKDWFHLPSFPLLDTANLMLQLRGGYDLKDASALEQVKKSKIPTLFIHGTEDEMVPYEMSQELYDAAVCEKELFLVEGAGHAQAPDKDPEGYYGKVEKFLEKHVRGAQTNV